VIFGAASIAARPAARPSTLAALALAAGVALTGAVVWGLAALVFHRQLSLVGLLIGLGAGLAVARYRPGHVPTIVAGAVITVAGCAIGTFLAVAFALFRAGASIGWITAHLNGVLRYYPSEVGWLGLVFWLIAAFAAVWVPLRARRAAGSTGGRPAGPAQTGNA
jgi:hypothetical protein